MSETKIMPGAEPFFFEGGKVGCLISHGFTGTTQSMRFLGEFLAREGGLTVIGPRLKRHGTTPEDMAQTTVEDWVRSAEEAMQVIMDNGAKRVLIPSENKRDFADIPSDVLDKLQIIFFSDPVNAAFRAMGVD